MDKVHFVEKVNKLVSVLPFEKIFTLMEPTLKVSNYLPTGYYFYSTGPSDIHTKTFPPV